MSEQIVLDFGIESMVMGLKGLEQLINDAADNALAWKKIDQLSLYWAEQYAILDAEYTKLVDEYLEKIHIPVDASLLS
jgi:hypothetical protein